MSKTKSAFSDRNPIAHNVFSSFNQINAKGDYLGIHDGKLMKSNEYIRYDVQALSGLSNHFQSVNRLIDSSYLVLSGGNSRNQKAELFIVHMKSRNINGPWKSNLCFRDKPPKSDILIKRIHLNKETMFNKKHGITKGNWHAGGMSVLGDILAIPLESKRSSKIIFYNLKNPRLPKLFNFVINRPTSKAALFGLTRLPSGYFLGAIIHSPNKGTETIDFYLSNETNFSCGFNKTPIKWNTKLLKAAKGQRTHKLSGYQCMTLTQDELGKLYFIGTHNHSILNAAPIEPGRDFADLFEILFVEKNLSNVVPDNFGIREITKVANKQMFCNHKQCNFDAAASVFVDRSKNLILYSCYHWVSDFELRFNEFRPNSEQFAKGTITSRSEAWIDLFDDKEFRDRQLSLVGKDITTISNYNEIFVRGDTFNDKVSSIKYQFPKGFTYILYEHDNFRGKKLILTGNGKVKKIPDLDKKKFGDKVSSSK